MDPPDLSQPELPCLEEEDFDEKYSDDDSSSPDLSHFRVKIARAYHKKPCTDCGSDFCPGDVCVEEPFHWGMVRQMQTCI